MEFSALATTKSELTNTSVVAQNIALKLVTEVGVTVSGQARFIFYLIYYIDYISFTRKQNEEYVQFKVRDTAVQFELRFHVEKYGTSPLHESEVKIKVPYETEKGKQFMKVLSIYVSFKIVKKVDQLKNYFRLRLGNVKI